ncbi:hypothetical protein CL89_gp086 [Aeromonas phage PX29]|uniref:Uncharacterized protein n=1 Tax=Aeromonas phage PX29 TaxID=926067 RepID=E5DQ19_9CAUD|nr:hypothetical protein CL89_gp086 [Aeromonas phage PX29]ADQ52805.1 conserved hypothetical protein [Aeromonas phage PX29]
MSSQVKSNRNKMKESIKNHNACRAILNHIFFKNVTVKGQTIRVYNDYTAEHVKKADRLETNLNMKRKFYRAFGDEAVVWDTASVVRAINQFASFHCIRMVIRSKYVNHMENSNMVKLGYAKIVNGVIQLDAHIFMSPDLKTLKPLKMMPYLKQENKELVAADLVKPYKKEETVEVVQLDEPTITSSLPPVSENEIKRQYLVSVNRFIELNHGEKFDRIRLLNEKMRLHDAEIERLRKERVEMAKEEQAIIEEINKARSNLLTF